MYISKEKELLQWITPAFKRNKLFKAAAFAQNDGKWINCMKTVGKRRYLQKILLNFTNDWRHSSFDPLKTFSKSFQSQLFKRSVNALSEGGVSTLKASSGRHTVIWGFACPAGRLSLASHTLDAAPRHSQRPYRKSRPKRVLKLKPISRPIFICKAVNLLSVTARL